MSATVVVVSACGGSGTSSSASKGGGASKGGTLTAGVNADVGKFDPAFSNLPTYDQYAYATPVFQTPDGKFSPYLASSWEFGKGNESITLTLRPDAKFSDGTTVTASAVADSMNRFRNTVSAKQFQARAIKAVKAVDDTTVELQFASALPEGYVLSLLAQGSAFAMIVAPSALHDETKLNTTTVGAGPYVLDPSASTTGSQYTYTPNKYYFAKDAVTYDKVVIKPFTDPTALANAANTGQVSYALSVGTRAVQSVKGAGLQISRGYLGIGDSGTAMLVLGNRKSGPLANQQVRDAIAYAIPRQDISKALYSGLAIATSSAAPPKTAGYSDSDPYPYDVNKAKQLLAQAGYPQGFELTVTSPTAYDPGNTLGQAVAAALGKIGIRVTLQKSNDNFSQTGANILAGKFDTYVYTSPGQDIFTTVLDGMMGKSFLNPQGTPLPNDLQQQVTTAATAAPSAQDGELRKVTDMVDTQAWFVTIAQIPRYTAVAKGVNNVPPDYGTPEPSPNSPQLGQSWSGPASR